MRATEEESGPCAALQHAAVADELRTLPTGFASSRCVCLGHGGPGEGPVCVCGQMESMAEAERASLWAMGDCAQLLRLTRDSGKIRRWK